MHDLYTVFSDLTKSNFRMLLLRAVKSGLLLKVCQNVFLYKRHTLSSTQVLCFTVSALRPRSINYVSLKTVLSESSIILQQMFNWLTVITTGCSRVIDYNE